MNPRQLTHEVLGVILAGVGVFTLASVVSFNAADLPARVAPAQAEVANLGGSLGVWLGGGLLTWVGSLGALGAAGLTLAFAVSCLRKPETLAADEDGAATPSASPTSDPVRRVVGALVVVLTLAVLERVAWRAVGPFASPAFSPGGYWGLFLEAQLLHLLGSFGAALALGVVGLVGVVLSTDKPLGELLGRSVQGAQEAAARAANGVAGSVASAEKALAQVSPERPEGAPARGPLEPVDLKPEADGADEADDGPPATPARGQGKDHKLPRADLLARPTASATPTGPVRDERGKRIEEELAQFRVPAKVVSIERGPAVTLFALELGKGIKVQRVVGLLDNLALALRVSGIRLQAPIPGTGWVGLEVPNEEQEVVHLRELLDHPAWRKKEPALPVFLGKDSSGRPLIADLAKMPHLLIAGATGSGKSVCINTIIVSLLMTRTTREVQLILVDPKQVELTQFKNVPHLLTPVVTDMRRAGAVLDWTVKKMEERYTWLAKAGVRHIREYNSLGKEALAERLGLEGPDALAEQRIPWRLPYIVVVVDELNDLMMIAQKEVEGSITRLAQKSRAVGIHVILATQRPSVDVITGVIKSNLPARLAFRVASKVDSRTILDCSGADKLLGNGDMLFLPPGRGQPIRALGAYVTDEEVRAVVKAVSRVAKPEFAEDLLAHAAAAAAGGASGKGGGTAASDDLYDDAVRVVLAEGKGSVSLVQRKLEIGYGRSARLLDRMAEEGIVGPARGAKPREVLTSLEAWEQQRAG
jgi:DNA segregation ATPase FtsK/SpoIIIE, S-DNA-T family